jgi:hypothetical protein
MTEEEKKLLLNNTEEVRYLKQVVEQLVSALKGDGMGNPGLIQRLDRAEHKREVQLDRDNELKQRLIKEHEEFKEFVFRQLDASEGNINRKFDTLSKNISDRFIEISTFKKELQEFKTRLEIYIRMLTGKSTWLFLFKAVGFIVGAGGLLYLLWKGGYEAAGEFIKQLLRK